MHFVRLSHSVEDPFRVLHQKSSLPHDGVLVYSEVGFPFFFFIIHFFSIMWIFQIIFISFIAYL